MDDFSDARTVAEKLTGKSRTNEDQVSEATLRLYKRGRDQFRNLVLNEVEKIQAGNHVVGVETWRRALDAEKRHAFDEKKKDLYQNMQRYLYLETVKDVISPEELACITLREKDKGHLNWEGDEQMMAVKAFVMENIERMWQLGKPVSPLIADWAGVPEFKPMKKRRLKK